jgi:hypothetical protein
MKADLKRGQQHPLQHRANRNCLTPQDAQVASFMQQPGPAGHPAELRISDFGLRIADLQSAESEVK